MSKFTRYEGDCYSQMRQMMTRSAMHIPITRYELATGVEAPPHLKIRRDSDQLVLDDGDLVVLEHLTRHERIVTLEHVELTPRQLGDKVEIDHLDTDDLVLPITTYLHNYIRMQFEDVLKVGDRVVLGCDDTNMVYYVLDRAKFYPKDHKQ